MGWLNASRVEGRRGTIDKEVEPFKVVRTVEFEPDLLEMQFVGGCIHDSCVRSERRSIKSISAAPLVVYRSSDVSFEFFSLLPSFVHAKGREAYTFSHVAAVWP